MKYIAFHKPALPTETYENLKKVVDSGWLTTGKKAQEFEVQIGKIIGAKHPVVVASGTAALHLAYLAAGVGPGDEVVVPSYTFCSTINTILHTGAKPVFCDIEEDSLCLNPQDVEARITKRTKAIVVVHFAGYPANMLKLNALAKKYNLKIIEDAAHAFLTQYRGRYIGSSKNLTCFSFYATKNLTTAEGGLVACPDAKTANFIRMMSMHGISRNAWKRYQKTGTWKYDVLLPGYKYNLSDIHASIGLAQLPKVKDSHKARLKLVGLYEKYLRDNPNVVLPKHVSEKQSEHAWHLYAVRIKPTSKMSRDEIVEGLKSAGIGTSVHFIPNHQQTLYRKLGLSAKLPVTDRIFKEVLSLPFYVGLKPSEVKAICQALNKLTT